MTTTFDYIISHGPCSDGELCAIIMQLYATELVKDATFIATAPGGNINVYTKDKTLLIMDTVPENLREILQVARKVYIYDHHKGNKETLIECGKEYDNLEFYFSDSLCAAEMVWNAFAREDYSWPIKVSSTHDCWRWNTSSAEYRPLWRFHFQGQITTTERYQQILLMNPLEIQNTVERVQQLLEQDELYIHQMINRAVLIDLETCVKAYYVETEKSDNNSTLGARLAEMSDCDFAIVANHLNTGIRKLSLRSYGKKADVDDIAKLLVRKYPSIFINGKGHANAAGMQCRKALSKLTSSDLVVCENFLLNCLNSNK